MRAPGITPIVRRKLKDGRIIVREGRGFSLNELKEAGITVEAARRLGIPVDKRRRSCREENVKALREFLAGIPPESGVAAATSSSTRAP